MGCLGCENYSVGLGIFPILFCACTSLTFLATYMIAVSNGHIYPWLPTISDTGGQKPEANIFSLFLSIGSFLGFIVFFLRYKQFDYVSNGITGLPLTAKFNRWNKWSFLVGVLASIGAGIVATFQDRGVSLLYHAIGAVTVFGGGVIYCWMQTYMTYCMLKLALNTRRLFWIRAILTFLATTSFVLFLVLFGLANKKLQEAPDSKQVKLLTKWNPDDPGFELHVVSSAFEWLLAVNLGLYLSTFIKEFNKTKVSLRVQRHPNEGVPFLASTISTDSMYS